MEDKHLKKVETDSFFVLVLQLQRRLEIKLC